jgi:hypothetical protein
MCNIPEDGILHGHCCENLKSNKCSFQKNISTPKLQQIIVHVAIFWDIVPCSPYVNRCQFTNGLYSIISKNMATIINYCFRISNPTKYCGNKIQMYSTNISGNVLLPTLKILKHLRLFIRCPLLLDHAYPSIGTDLVCLSESLLSSHQLSCQHVRHFELQCLTAKVSQQQCMNSFKGSRTDDGLCEHIIT